MATYVISDIHGEYGKFMELLDMIHFRMKIYCMCWEMLLTEERTR